MEDKWISLDEQLPNNAQQVVVDIEHLGELNATFHTVYQLLGYDEVFENAFILGRNDAIVKKNRIKRWRPAD